MSLAFHTSIEFDAAADASLDGEALIIDLGDYEGPLDVLLALARAQKVDLLKLSIARLTDQYLAFIREARGRRFALAADYLVMAAWLAWLKSRLLLPKPPTEADAEMDPEAVAARLAFRLAKLDAMRGAAESLQARPILGRDVFTRGDAEVVTVVSSTRVDGDLFGLVAAYVRRPRRGRDQRYRPPTPQAYRLDEARERLRTLVPGLRRWTALSGVVPSPAEGGATRASCLASTLSASLELVREGALEARQLSAFQEVYLRGRKAAA